MPSEPRRQQRAHWSLEVRMDAAENDLDDLEETDRERGKRVTQLQLLAAGLLITVCTGIIGLFWAGVIGS